VGAPLRLLFFATAREAVGRSHLERAVANDGVPLDGLLAELVAEFPRLGPVLRSSRLVLNGEYLRGHGIRLRGGDELAVHPPYSGG
jgi:molybdopterin converting factor small subunit